MGDDPRFEDSFELAMSFVGGEESVVLVAARNINVNLTISAGDRVFVNVGILPVKITLEMWRCGDCREGRDIEKDIIINLGREALNIAKSNRILIILYY